MPSATGNSPGRRGGNMPKGGNKGKNGQAAASGGDSEFLLS